MSLSTFRRSTTRLLCVCLIASDVACTRHQMVLPETPTAAGYHAEDLVDPNAYGGEGPPPSLFRGLYAVGEKLREDRKPAVLPPKKTVLVLSGGGSYGAYSAGVLVGWTEAGTRPRFDVVTGVSTGALIAVLAFLGSDYDAELQRLYTTLRSEDVLRKKIIVTALFSDSLADNTPLLRQIDQILTPDLLAKVGKEHQKGRRLYVGTTDQDGRRPVVWDLGAIALKGTPESRELFGRILLASAAIPGFFSATPIPVIIDGKRYVERHVDGGLTQPLFFRPPYIPPDQRDRPLSDLFYGSDQYIIVAGKLFADPEPVKPQLLKIVTSSVSTFIYAQTRDALVKMYTQTLLTGFNYNLTAIPQEFDVPLSSTDFDPVQMKRMFEEGRRQILSGQAWRANPPGVGEAEGSSERAGNQLQNVPGVTKQAR